jgi:hypothetical protein
MSKQEPVTLQLLTEWGDCPDCGTPLQNWGAASDNTGAIFDEIGCPLCEEVRRQVHATYCKCPACAPLGTACTICGAPVIGGKCTKCVDLGPAGTAARRADPTALYQLKRKAQRPKSRPTPRQVPTA